MVGSHLLGEYLPSQRSIFTLTGPVYCLFASKITDLWNVRVTSLSDSTPSGHKHQPGAGTTNPLIVHCYLLIVDCQLTRTHLCRKKQVSLILLLIHSQRSACFAFSSLPNLSPTDFM